MDGSPDSIMDGLDPIGSSVDPIVDGSVDLTVDGSVDPRSSDIEFIVSANKHFLPIRSQRQIAVDITRLMRKHRLTLSLLLKILYVNQYVAYSMRFKFFVLMCELGPNGGRK